MTAAGTITHIVLAQWKPGITADALAELSAIAARFQAEIPGVLTVVEGPSVSPEGLENGFDWGMVVTFTGADARDGYLTHPTHAPASAWIGEHAERVAVFDLAG